MSNQATLDELNEQLTEAKQARRDIALGNQIKVAWRVGGNRAEYNLTTLEQVNKLIETLKAEIRDCQEEMGIEVTGARKRPPIAVYCP